jgi:hypothetical protein
MRLVASRLTIYGDADQVDSEALVRRGESREKKKFSKELTILLEVSTLVNALETAQVAAKRSEPRKNNSLKAI